MLTITFVCDACKKETKCDAVPHPSSPRQNVGATPDFTTKFSRTDEPGEAKGESTLAETGHIKVPRAMPVGLHTPLTCLACGKSWAYEVPQTFFEVCPVCQCTQFYKQKDFNRAFGCLIMLVGIALVPVTYGLSLPVFFLADWLLQRKVSDMGICYRCGAEFREFMLPAHLKEFMHHIGEKYERKVSEAKRK